MATSAPTPPADPAAAPPVEHQQVLDTIADQTAAIDDLIGRARHSIRVFDYDLSETGWNGKARAENLATFLRTNRNARLDIILHDTRWLERSCPRMTNLLKLFSHAITIYRTGPGAKGAMDPLMIVDGRHFLHRYHIEQPRATLAIEAPHAANPLARRFEEIWATGEPGITGTVLGL